MTDNAADTRPAPLTRIVDGRVVPIPGVWDIDGLHTHTGFAVRHLLTIMRGRFREQQGVVVIADDPTESSVEVTIQVASIDTIHPQADETLRSERFLDVAAHPTIEFHSTRVVPAESGDWTIVGDLTIMGRTFEVELDTEFLGAATHPMGDQPVMSFSCTTSITRDQWGMDASFEVPDSVGVLVMGNRIDLQLDVEADLRRE